MSGQITHWKAEHQVKGPNARPNISFMAGLGFGQELRFNIRPELVPFVVHSLMTEYVELMSKLEEEE